ncbi:HSP20-like chaperone [Hygrophoropsis aurantiaca]|uniref:HSP20-like chaperone n=1 Tax=Hygrophoropsis aurantiaca TaxID=72124 RepID=A0ACB8AQH5_9AGAM|nr:HSP20-like chaperone [Hygrophoropsis aurantiaca]
MSITHWYYDPSAEFERLFDDALSSRFRTGNILTEIDREKTFKPKMDLKENDDGKSVTAFFDLPGLKKEDATIDVNNDRLIVSGEVNTSSERDEEGYAVRERSCGKFSRTLQLPQNTKAEDVKAKIENGVLTVTFPKVKAQQEAQRVTIN